MRIIDVRVLTACCAVAIASSAFARGPSGLLRYSQPWNEGLGSHPSARGCDGTVELFMRSVWDDFVWSVDTQISRVTWWGTNPTSPNIPNKYFYIEISPDTQDPNTGGDCSFPEGAHIFSGCVRASALNVGVDCEGRPVYRFDAALDFPVPLFGGLRYHLIIAEADVGIAGVVPDSQNVGEVDFAWSGHRHPRGITLGCNPVSLLPSPLTLGPVVDPCDDQDVDMAFVLHRNVVKGILFPRALLKANYRFELRELGTENIVAVETSPLAADRSFFVSFDVAEGLYDLVVTGPDIPSTSFPNIDLSLGSVDLGGISGNVIDASRSAWLFGNPWDRNRGAILMKSTVASCAPLAEPAGSVLGDDYGAGPNDPAITRIEWWGINPLFDGMPERHFMIRAYEGVSCNPNQLPTHAAAPFYSVCVEASAKVVGTDCNGDTVFRFNALLPMPIQPPSEQIIRFLEIAEIDELSLHPGEPDFAWSPAITQIGCIAMINQAGQPLPAFSFCLSNDLEIPVDLAFALYKSVFTGQLSALPELIVALRAQLCDSTTGQVIATQRFEPNSDGSFMVSFDAPDGTYDLVISGGPSVGGRVSDVVLTSGVVTSLGVVDFPLGDANASGQVTFADITEVLANWLRMTP